MGFGFMLAFLCSTTTMHMGQSIDKGKKNRNDSLLMSFKFDCKYSKQNVILLFKKNIDALDTI